MKAGVIIITYRFSTSPISRTSVLKTNPPLMAAIAVLPPVGHTSFYMLRALLLRQTRSFLTAARSVELQRLRPWEHSF
jgi:hypothetical protein